VLYSSGCVLVLNALVELLLDRNKGIYHMDYSIWDKDYSAWLIAARSEQLGKADILQRKIMKTPMVLFRDNIGEAHALLDRCPHKGLPLSLGRKQANGNISCGYHGWEFDGSGACVSSPCLGLEEPKPVACVNNFPTKEQDGWIWILWGKDEQVLADGPPNFPREKSFRWFELQRVVNASPHFILENSFDCTHACFVHRGLFRNAPAQFVDAEISETDYGLRVETCEKDAHKMPLTKYIPWSADEVWHSDEYFKPFTACVNYKYGFGAHRIILTCTPVDENETVVYTRSGISAGFLTFLAYWAFRILTPFIIPQDVRVIEAQGRTFSKFGGNYQHLRQADAPALWMLRAYRNFFEKRPRVEDRSLKINYKL